MYQEVSHLLIKKFSHTNMLTIDDIYDISDKYHLNIILLYRTIVLLIKKNILEKILILNTYDKTIIVDKKDFDTEFAIVKKRKKNPTKTLSQKEIDTILSL